MTALEYMKWFINHSCYLNHTGSTQGEGEGRGRGCMGERIQVDSFGLKESINRWHFVTCKMNVTVIISKNV